jgi:hypothetical protein
MQLTTIPTLDRPRATTDSASWTLVRDGCILSCALFELGDQRYAFQVVPIWHAGLTITETFGSLSDAAYRSATVTQKLRDCGWLLAQRVGLPAAV